jgi:hypothetical protein
LKRFVYYYVLVWWCGLVSNQAAAASASASASASAAAVAAGKEQHHVASAAV